jgi:hypothetical protein
VKYQSSDTTLKDWLLFVAMLCVGAAAVIALGWLIVFVVLKALKG